MSEHQIKNIKKPKEVKIQTHTNLIKLGLETATKFLGRKCVICAPLSNDEGRPLELATPLQSFRTTPTLVKNTAIVQAWYHFVIPNKSCPLMAGGAALSPWSSLALPHLLGYAEPV
ncbi:hypothetical protein AVEN_9870-1 [Araneus ventricosus]|uniref:Uncharacterized protein n=1 Tax=Araneus ventricosus TaxID=182803 RepID=A0A4Y2EEK0_ARAVE|nr:hypothetical protein AVEN_9870-1 [Araneus ventricosus]